MPQMNRALLFQLGIILLIVPVQFFITQRWKPASQSTQQQTVKDIVGKYRYWQNLVLSKATWIRWYDNVRDSLISYKNNVVEQARTYATTSKAAPYEKTALVTLDEATKEILQRRDSNGNFASSAIARNPRPAHIKFHIGQVIRHREYGYRGVIVGWDATAKAPEQWLRSVHGGNKPQLRYQPSYSILVDDRDRPGGQVTYIAEDHIMEVMSGHQVSHPEVKDYFNGFNGKEYIAKPWLKKIYPQDQ